MTIGKHSTADAEVDDMANSCKICSEKLDAKHDDALLYCLKCGAEKSRKEVRRAE